jgi:hypothetical protein
VACSGRRLAVLLPGGTALGGFPRTVGDTLRCAAAIGDVDGDGANEIVTVYADTVRVDQRASLAPAMRKYVKGATFSVTPSLADFDLDGDLEIVAPTEQGGIQVLHDDGTSYGNGWPLSAGSLGPMTSAALADGYGGSAPEIFIGQRDSSLRVFEVTPLSESRPSPYNVGIGVSVFNMPIVETLDEGARAMIFGSLNSWAYAWPANSSPQQPGWPG